ncbi:MAG TPA: hypothetical protein VH092_12355 [Urbifossiella sp.]|jgi:hypothetical protein|nr:hypothetical protein [Urbifossiella sp.]
MELLDTAAADFCRSVAPLDLAGVPSTSSGRACFPWTAGADWPTTG